MHYSTLIKPALILGLASLAQPAYSRGVVMLDFNSRTSAHAEAEAPTVPAVDQIQDSPASGSSQVGAMMVHELQRYAAPPTMLDASGFERPLPTDTVRIPAWMRTKADFARFPLSSAASFADGLMGGRYDRCDMAVYVPAWWLDAKTEARRAYHFGAVAAAACQYGIPTYLLDAVISQESRYKAWAISPKGAMGLMQIMPGTARELGLVNAFDAAANINAGARYLRQQLDRFGRVDLALAAYNAGPHRQSLREGRLPMIAETLGYVRSIMMNWGRLAPRTVEIASVDRGSAAAAVVAASPLRRATLVRYDGLAGATAF